LKFKINDIITYLTVAATFITLVAGFVTIVWFIQDSRNENSKVLKRQEQILIKIEEGQRESSKDQIRGFETLSTDLKSIQKSLEIQTKALENVQKSSEIQTKILEKIEAK